MKYLIVGLGNIGDEYQDTRHNIGFMVLDEVARSFDASFTDRRYGWVCEIRYRGKTMILLKPSTFVNLSGNAVRYWLRKEKIPVEGMLVIVDDIALPLGSIRMRPKGNDGGHNGLAHINTILATTGYPRIRVGIGDSFPKGAQVDYVLSKWSEEEKKFLEVRIKLVSEMIRSFVTRGVELTMTTYNKAGRIASDEAGREADKSTL
ncbi:MAG: aminoacyl-tRNA hydrolase [Bacteroidales bacterium]